MKFTPFYEELLKERAEEWRRLVIHYTSRLFLNPFDEKFVEDALERVKIEIGLAADMRTRGTIAQSILTNFSRELRRRFGLSRRKALQLTDVAQRVLTFDAANAIVLHYSARVRAAKKHGNELSGAIKDFDEAVRVCVLRERRGAIVLEAITPPSSRASQAVPRRNQASRPKQL